jgi:hypothetical protein
MNEQRRPSPLPFLLLAVLVFISLAESVSLLKTGRVHSNDYKHLWLGTRVLAEGGSPYDPAILLTAARQFDIDSINPYVYLPATALFLRPFGKLPLQTSIVGWFALNWLLAWTAVLLGPRWVRLERPQRAQLFGALFLIGSMPFVRQMTAGQMNLIVLGSVVLAWGWLIRGRDLAAGVVLGLAAAFKIAPLFFLMPLFGLRRWRAVGGLGLGFAVTNLVAMVLFGTEVHREALPVLSNMGYGQSTWSQFGMDFYRDPFNQSVNALMHHLFTENPYTTPWMNLGPGLANGLTWMVSLFMLGGFAVLLGIRFFGTQTGIHLTDESWGERESSLYLLGVLLMLMLPSLLWDHYCLQVLPIIFWMTGREAGRGGALRSASLLAAFAFLAFPWIHTAEAFRQGPGILLMSFRLWGLLILLGWLFVEARRLIRYPEGYEASSAV